MRFQETPARAPKTSAVRTLLAAGALALSLVGTAEAKIDQAPKARSAVAKTLHIAEPAEEKVEAVQSMIEVIAEIRAAHEKKFGAYGTLMPQYEALFTEKVQGITTEALAPKARKTAVKQALEDTLRVMYARSTTEELYDHVQPEWRQAKKPRALAAARMRDAAGYDKRPAVQVGVYETLPYHEVSFADAVSNEIARQLPSFPRAQRYGTQFLQRTLLQIVLGESGNRYGDVSPKQAAGLMQLVRSNRTFLNHDNPLLNIGKGVEIFLWNMNHFAGKTGVIPELGELDGAQLGLLAYNIGVKGVQDAISGEKPISQEGRNYLAHVQKQRPGAAPEVAVAEAGTAKRRTVVAAAIPMRPPHKPVEKTLGDIVREITPVPDMPPMEAQVAAVADELNAQLTQRIADMTPPVAVDSAAHHAQTVALLETAIKDGISADSEVAQEQPVAEVADMPTGELAPVALAIATTDAPTTIPRAEEAGATTWQAAAWAEQGITPATFRAVHIAEASVTEPSAHLTPDTAAVLLASLRAATTATPAVDVVTHRLLDFTSAPASRRSQAAEARAEPEKALTADVRPRSRMEKRFTLWHALEERAMLVRAEARFALQRIAHENTAALFTHYLSNTEQRHLVQQLKQACSNDNLHVLRHRKTLRAHLTQALRIAEERKAERVAALQMRMEQITPATRTAPQKKAKRPPSEGRKKAA